VADESTPRIYTRTGDAGETALFDGTRVTKTDPRIEACGDVDELAACLGVVRALVPADQVDLARLVEDVQRGLFAVGALVADPSHRISARVTKASPDALDVGRLERAIDELEAGLPPLRRFILAGGTPAGAALHLARAVCRRAERRVVALGRDAVDDIVLAYLNRLSDLLFVMARAVNARAGVSETEW